VIESARRQTAKILSDSVKKPLANAELAATVVRSIESAINVLENICQEIISSSDTDVGLYTITIHGMKGALANIGETDLSNNAQKLEQAGENRDIAVISSETPDFIDALRLLVIKYKPKEKIESAEISNDDMAFLREKLNVIKETCEVYNISETEAALNELKRRTWPRMISGFLDDVAENLLCGKVKEIIAAVDNFIKTTNEELQGESD
jgi:HPt (histidine-containing phosphotransfer) domain-containing protein